MVKPIQSNDDRSRNFVLAHGSWHGGWCWEPVAERLRAAGHRVFAPSYTGMGDRAHLISKAITIDTFVEDLVGLIEAEELWDVVLVGHRSEEHTSELQSLMRISYAVFCLKKKNHIYLMSKQ